MMKPVVLAALLALPLGTAAMAQHAGPVNPGSGPTAGGVVNEGPVEGRPLLPGAAPPAPSPGGAQAPSPGAGPTAGGVVNETLPAGR